ncbi:MAG: PEGA domain-containing protein [Myxococcaceae bacterium]|nr:PEGA domain-containing protein [Myxococcaceae bacterium]
MSTALLRSTLVLSLAASALLSGPASAQSTAVVISGDCKDPDLISAARELTRELPRVKELKVLSESEVVDKLGRSPTRSVEEIRRQLDTAQQQFYQAQYHKAVAQLETAMQDIIHLPPGQARWQLWVSASVLDGLVRGRLNKSAAASDAFRRVLRIDPTYKLDPDYFSPSTIKEFDRIRAEVVAAKKVTFMVKTNPSGATVYIDGKSFGKTPFVTELLPGSYQVSVGANGVFSLPRQVDVVRSAPSDLFVDLGFESAIDTERVPCISGVKNESVLLAHANKLGSVLDLEQLVLMRFERQQIGPSWLAAALIKIKGGEKIREGGLQVTARGYPPHGIEELARFIITGESSDLVLPQPTGRPQTSPPTRPERPAEPSSLEPVATVESTPSPSWRKPVGQSLTAAGAVVLAAGIGFQVSSILAHRDYQAWVDGGRLPGEPAVAAREALDRSNAHQLFAYVGYGVGAVAAGAGLFLWLGNRSATEPASTAETTPQVSVLPTREGLALSATVRF